MGLTGEQIMELENAAPFVREYLAELEAKLAKATKATARAKAAKATSEGATKDQQADKLKGAKGGPNRPTPALTPVTTASGSSTTTRVTVGPLLSPGTPGPEAPRRKAPAKKSTAKPAAKSTAKKSTAKK